MFPDNFIPSGAYQKAVEQRDKLREARGFYDNSQAWTNLGPTPGYYFSYGNISSRITTNKYDPVNPNTLYIGAAFGGVWKSTGGGSTWAVKTDFEVSLSSGAIAIDPVNTNIIYYGTGEATYSGASYYGRGLLKSTNGGNNWTNITSGLEPLTYFSRIVIRPGHSSELLAALGNRSSLGVTGGLYRSTDAGLNWAPVIAGRCDEVIFSPTGDTAYAAGSGMGYVIWTNGGVSFTHRLGGKSGRAAVRRVPGLRLVRRPLLRAQLAGLGRIEEVKGRKVVVSAAVSAGGEVCARGKVVAVQMPETLMPKKQR